MKWIGAATAVISLIPRRAPTHYHREGPGRTSRWTNGQRERHMSSLNAAMVRARGYPMGAIDVPVPDQLATFTWLARMPGVSGRAQVNDVVVATLNSAMRR